MVSTQILTNCIEELHGITKVNLCICDADGLELTSTFEDMEITGDMIRNFISSPADSQVIGKNHLLKITDDGELVYILIACGTNDDSYMVGKIAVSQLQQLISAYKERFDRNNFFQNLLMDNLLLVEAGSEKDTAVAELLKGMFSAQTGDFVTEVDEKYVILIKSLTETDGYPEIEKIAQSIVDTISAEAMTNVHVSYGTIVQELKDVSKSYKEAMMAIDVGKIFYAEKRVNSYATLGIGRLIYQLPTNLCKIFIEEIFGDSNPGDLDEEIVFTAYKFFENNLNVSETSRQLFIHRNTLVYRIEKLEKATGLDVRTFDDALTFKIAMMVYNYMRYLDNQMD